jgi:hypothetical protein
MSLNTRVEDTRISECQPIDDIIQDSLRNEYISLKWMPNSEFNNLGSMQTFIDQKFSYKKLAKGIKRFSSLALKNVNSRKSFTDQKVPYRYAVHKQWNEIILLLLGNKNGKCTPAFVNEFARIYSIPTYTLDNKPNHMGFRRYPEWLYHRNIMIKGFTNIDDNYYLVAEGRFLCWYYRYGFCSACGILRCSPVWCICGHKELSTVWTSNNKKLDDFIKKSQIQTNSANDAYLEWIPFYCIEIKRRYTKLFNDLPIYSLLKLIPLEIENDLCYDKVRYSIMFINIHYVYLIHINYYSNSYAMIIQIFLLQMFG